MVLSASIEAVLCRLVFVRNPATSIGAEFPAARMLFTCAMRIAPNDCIVTASEACCPREGLKRTTYTPYVRIPMV
eukprot:1863556-Rhodomonas_salina.2